MHRILIQKFGFDAFNEWFWIKGAKNLGQLFFKFFDQRCIDGIGVNGSAWVVGKLAVAVRHIQTGYLFHYLSIMVIGLMMIIFWFLLA